MNCHLVIAHNVWLKLGIYAVLEWAGQNPGHWLSTVLGTPGFGTSIGRKKGPAKGGPEL